MPLFQYPSARRSDHTDTYHGTIVADPYRWMEDPDNEETIAYSEAQSKLAFDYLEELPMRPKLIESLTKHYNTEKYSSPQKRGNWYYLFKNDGLQNQNVLYRTKTIGGDLQEVLDPNQFSDDGTIALVNWSISEDGSHLAYTTSDGGTDWQTVHILNVDTGAKYDETLSWCRWTGMAWIGNDGFYYSRYPETDDKEDADSTKNQMVMYHTLGTPQSDDTLIYKRPDEPTFGFYAYTSDDDKYLLLKVWHAAVNRNRLYYRLHEDRDGDFVRLLDEADAEYRFVGSVGDTFYIQTDKDAERGRVIALDVNHPDVWRDIIPESETDTIDSATIVNDKLVVVTMHNAHHQVNIYDLEGNHLNSVELPTMGRILGVVGKPKHDEMFMQFMSYLYPPTIIRYDFNEQSTSIVYESPRTLNPDEYVTKQVFYPSKDGTQVSMFITHKKGIELDGSHLTMLYGYGGYSIPLLPQYEPQILNWVEHGGVYCVANLRGGSEYGDAWHKAGMLHNKQNVFDDFIAAGEWLIENGYTANKKLAIMGRSNGGLLVAACMLQRPDLFGGVICGVPVTDMLRFHKFTAGRYWVDEYGNAEEDADLFEIMFKYSPVHNVKSADYPATLILSADLDDRVVPMHAKKFAAELQYHNTGDNPMMFRLDTRSGHGFGKPTTKWIHEWADIHAFLMQHLGD